MKLFSTLVAVLLFASCQTTTVVADSTQVNRSNHPTVGAPFKGTKAAGEYLRTQLPRRCGLTYQQVQSAARKNWMQTAYNLRAACRGRDRVFQDAARRVFQDPNVNKAWLKRFLDDCLKAVKSETLKSGCALTGSTWVAVGLGQGGSSVDMARGLWFLLEGPVSKTDVP